MGTENVWIRMDITAPEGLVEAICSFLDDVGVEGCYQESLVEGEEGDAFPHPEVERITAHIPKDGRHEEILSLIDSYLVELKELFPEASLSLSSTTVENPDWHEAWKQYFRPLRLGKNIVIKPSWESFTPTAHDIVVEIDPGMAFGTGQHASSRLCMEELEALLIPTPRSSWRMLDVGTGTGILAIYAAKAGMADIVAIDPDHDAIAIARENAHANNVSEQIAFQVADIGGFAGTFDLVVANLTTKTLVANHQGLCQCLAAGGYLILSGIIEKDASDIERTFVTERLGLCRKNVSDGWLCYTLKKCG